MSFIKLWLRDIRNYLGDGGSLPNDPKDVKKFVDHFAFDLDEDGQKAVGIDPAVQEAAEKAEKEREEKAYVMASVVDKFSKFPPPKNIVEDYRPTYIKNRVNFLKIFTTLDYESQKLVNECMQATKAPKWVNKMNNLMLCVINNNDSELRKQALRAFMQNPS
jgi:hypothetical protein